MVNLLIPSKMEQYLKISTEKYFNNEKMAIDVFNKKYALIINGCLETPGECFYRVAKYIASAEIDDGFSQEQADELTERWFFMMWNRDMVAGGRINYGAGNPAHVSLSNCTTTKPPEDNLESIYDTAKKMARVLSLGEGVGVDVTNLRPEGMTTNNAARTTSGAISWMEIYDATTGWIAQNHRRGALLISIKISHPETLKFIKVKSDLNKILNANISLQITDDFMKAVIEDGNWTFNWTNDKGYNIKFETVKARDVMREIAIHSSIYAEPGLQFWDIVRKYSNSDTLGIEWEVCSSNACGEQALDFWGQCNLSHQNWATLPLNLEAAEIEAENRGYYISWFLDNVVTKQIVDKRSPLPESAFKLKSLRRLGQGFTGLADYFSKIGIAYDSKEAIVIAAKLTKAMTKGAYARSIKAGAERGNYPAFNKEKLLNSQFIKNMIVDDVIPADFKTMRNVCNTTVAPVGTGNLMVQGWAGGTEPGIGFVYWRRTRISGEYVWYFVVNEFVYELIKNDSQLVKSIQNRIAIINETPIGLIRFAMEDKVIELLDGKIDFNVHKFSHLVDPFKKADLMGAIQRYIDSALSVTYNMSESTTVEQIEELYIRCWKNGLKGVAIYREDPSNRPPIYQFTRPNTFNYNISNEIKDLTLKESSELVIERAIQKRPERLTGYTKTFRAENNKFYFTFNFDDKNNLYEIFCQSNAREPKVSTEAALEILIETLMNFDVPQVFIDDQLNKSKHQASHIKICRLISLGLRHGVPIEIFVAALDTLNVTVISYIFHLKKSLLELIDKYVEKCNECGENTLIIENGCKHCDNCSNSQC